MLDPCIGRKGNHSQQVTGAVCPTHLVVTQLCTDDQIGRDDSRPSKLHSINGLPCHAVDSNHFENIDCNKA